MSKWKPIKDAPTDGTRILGGIILDGKTIARSAVWYPMRVTKYNPDGGVWGCPYARSVIGPFTHYQILDDIPEMS